MTSYEDFRKLADVDNMPLAPSEFVLYVNQVRTAIPALLANIEMLHGSLAKIDLVAAGYRTRNEELENLLLEIGEKHE